MNEAKILYGISYEEYDKLEGLRSSDLNNLKRSPRYFQYCKAYPKEPTDSMDFGKLVHSAMEDCKGFASRLLVEPKFEGKTKDGKLTTSLACLEVKQKREAWFESLAPDAVIVKEEWHEKLSNILESIATNAFVRGIIRQGSREVSIQVRDPETGIMLKCRPDLIALDKFLVDFKTTSDARPQRFMRAIFDQDYFFYILQMAHYVYCMKLAGIGDGESATILAIENEPGFDIRPYPLERPELEVGEEARIALMGLYMQCLSTNKWPGYQQKAVPTGIPTWVKPFTVDFDFGGAI